MPKRIWIPSPNYSSRQGADVRLIVLHTAEGARDIESLGHFFANQAVQVSSHAGADDRPNTIGEFVKRDKKAWTQGNFNPVSVGIEMCAFARWGRDEWFRHPNLLENCARWIAEEAAHFRIPLVKLNPSQAQGGGRGICYHQDLGAAGGGHQDPGAGFPMDYVLTLAHGVPQDNEEDSLITSVSAHNGTLHVFQLHDGWVWYSYQPAGRLTWSGAQGNEIANMHKFAPAPGVVSIAAGIAGDGTLHLFGRKKDGSVVFTYQKPASTGWAGGRQGGDVAGLHAFARAPR